jgi:hypothetical protein
MDPWGCVRCGHNIPATEIEAEGTVTLTITLTKKQAERIRKDILRGGYYIHPKSAQGVLLAALKESGVGPQEGAKCGHSHLCPFVATSEDLMYRHLISGHGYPSEDAGSTAGRAWRER